MKNKLFFILTKPLFLSIFLSTIVLYITHPLFPKYRADLINKEKVRIKYFKFYEDLDNDGYSEEIALDKAYENKNSVIVRSNGAVIDQWIFRGNLNMNEPFIGDFNNDGIKEIFLLTLDKNDILLNCFSPIEKKSYITNKLIDKFYPKNNETNSGCTYCELSDLNNDKISEFIFAFSAGFSISPRKIYSYNFVNDSLSESKQGCMTIRNVNKIKKNSSSFFLISNDAVGNCDSNIIYSDQFTRLTVLNSDLQFKFEPVKVGYYPSSLLLRPIKIENIFYLIALNIDFGNSNNNCSIGLYDLDGKKIKEKKFPFSTEWNNVKFINSNDLEKLYLIRSNGNIEELDSNLELTKICKILPNTHPNPKSVDCDRDGVDEIIFHHETSEKISILRNDLQDPIIIDVPGNDYLYYAGIILNGNKKPLLNLKMDNYSYLFEYYKNPLYSYRFIFYFLIYFGIFGFLYVLQKAQNYRLQQKFNAQKEISELQMKSIKNQIDSHFTLNIINSIGSLFSKQETEKANYIFGKYSKLLRQTILSSDQILTTLNDELEYVENYLILEQFRIKDGFDYRIDIESDINGEIKIPKMLIHSFVENSIKHGIRHINNRGSIIVSVIIGNGNYQIKVTDNGIGREKAKELSKFSTGKGLEIIDQILQLYYTLEKVRITYEFTDMENKENNTAGTEVLINIPILKT